MSPCFLESPAGTPSILILFHPNCFVGSTESGASSRAEVAWKLLMRFGKARHE